MKQQMEAATLIFFGRVFLGSQKCGFYLCFQWDCELSTFFKNLGVSPSVGIKVLRKYGMMGLKNKMTKERQNREGDIQRSTFNAQRPRKVPARFKAGARVLVLAMPQSACCAGKVCRSATDSTWCGLQRDLADLVSGRSDLIQPNPT